MKTIGQHIISLLVASTFLSCETEPLYVTKIPTDPSQIVISSTLLNNAQLYLLLTNSFSALEPQSDSTLEFLSALALKNAEAELIKGTKRYPLTEVYDGLYTLPNFKLDESESYILEVTDRIKKRQVKSSTQLLPKVEFDIVSPSVEVNFDTIVSIYYKFQDLSGPNWYMITVQRGSQKDLQNLGGKQQNVYTELIDDNDQTKAVIQGKFKVLNYPFRRGDTILVSLANIRKDYYSYLEIRAKEKNWLINPTLEPFNYPTNVENGLGFFTLYYQDIKTFDLSNY